MERKRILISDVHPTMLSAVRVLLRDAFDATFMVADDRSLIDAATHIRPDLIITDLSMPVSSGENVVGLLHRVNPELRVIALSVHDEQTIADACLAAGAKGYVLKRTAVDDLIPAVEAVMRGDIYVSPSIGSVRKGAGSKGRQ